MVISMVVGVIVGFLVFRDARQRNKTMTMAALWAAGAALQPFIIGPIYLLWGRRMADGQTSQGRREDDVIDIEATVVENSVPCPMCARQVQEDFKVCPYCGYTLQPKCGHCGQELKRGDKVCPHCQTAAGEK